MEFKNYDYTKRPASMSRVYDIHSLSNRGLNQYLSKESNFHNYIDKINQNNLDRIHKKQNSEIKFNQDPIKKYFIEENYNNNNEYYNNVEEYQEEENNQNNFKSFNSFNFNGNSTNRKTYDDKGRDRRPFNSMVTNKSVCSFYGNKGENNSNNYLNLRRMQYATNTLKKTINNESLKSNINRLEKSYSSNLNNLSTKVYLLNKNKTQDNFYNTKKNSEMARNNLNYNNENNMEEKEYIQIRRNIISPQVKSEKTISNFKRVQNQDIYTKLSQNSLNFKKNSHTFNPKKSIKGNFRMSTKNPYSSNKIEIKA